jgi:MFS family permease
LRIWSISLFVLVAPLLYFLKPRIPSSHRHLFTTTAHKFDLTFLAMRNFALFQFCNVLEALGYFLPTIWLPTYAQQYLNATNLQGAFTIIAINVASVFGCVIMGSIMDRYHVTTGILISSIPTTLSVFLFWGLSTNLALLYLFCVAYGLFAGSFSSTWTGIIHDVQRKNEGADAGLIFAFLAFGRGVGNVVSGPLSEALVHGKPWFSEAAASYGSGYGPLIAFTGVSALLGGGSFFGRRIGWL